MSETICVISNFPSKATEDILKKIFSAYGTIKTIHINKDINTAEIGYETREEALKAVAEMNNKEILKSKVQVYLKGSSQESSSAGVIFFFKLIL